NKCNRPRKNTTSQYFIIFSFTAFMWFETLHAIITSTLLFSFSNFFKKFYNHFFIKITYIQKHSLYGFLVLRKNIVHHFFPFLCYNNINKTVILSTINSFNIFFLNKLVDYIGDGTKFN